ncbi:helix-turn-helix transcriptional regulator [Kitasatospora cineracea]
MPAQVIAIAERGFITPLEMAELANVTPKTLANWRALGTGPEFIKLSPGRGGRVRYPEASVQSWLKARRPQAA